MARARSGYRAGMRQRLAASVVVVAGGSSGAGLAAAHEFARHGARLVLAGRGTVALDAAADACRRLGAEVLAVPTDVAVAADVDRLVDAAVARFGRIDTWVEAAAGLLAGTLPDCPPEQIERLLRTNVVGPAFGARAALTRFEQQGHGTLVLVSSVLGVTPNPMVPAYAMSKFAVHGLAASLRTGLPRFGPIRVCEVMPGPLDTPMFARAGNFSGRALRAIPPACAPERAAAAIVACARRPRRLAVVGHMGRVVLLGLRIAPQLTQWAVAQYSARLLVTRHPHEPDAGAVTAAVDTPGRTTGGWRWWALRRTLGAAVGRALARRGNGRTRSESPGFRG